MNTLVYELEYIPVEGRVSVLSEQVSLIPIGLVSRELLSLLATQVKTNSGLDIYISHQSTANKTILIIARDSMLIGRVFVTVDKLKSEILEKIERISDLIEQQIKRDIKNN